MARKQHRKVIESMYEHTCTIQEYEGIKDPVSKQTNKKVDTVLENQPCGISYENIRNANSTESATTITQIIKLSIAPEIVIKPGSKLIIADKNNNVTEYKNSGVPAVYSGHQEIVLELFKGWA